MIEDGNNEGIGAILSTQVGEHGGKMGQRAVGWIRVGPTGIPCRAGRVSGYIAVGFMVGVGLHPLPTILYPCRDPQGMRVRADTLAQVRFVVVIWVVVIIVHQIAGPHVDHL